MSEQDDGLFGLDGTRDPVAEPPDDGPRGGRRRWLVTGLALAAAAVVAAVALGAASAAPSAPVAAPATTPSSPAVATPTATVDPEALDDLRAVATTLTTPVRLTSPAAWDRWLPEGKPFPGPSLDEEIATCPRLASRLTAALGREMSYWTGTLPGGPYGCHWVPVPLVYDSPDYDYVIGVGFLADGTTPESLATGYATAGGPCPWIEVPAAAPGAVLVGCSTGTSAEYTLALPDSRVPGGLWTLIVSAKSRAAVPAADILPVLVEGVVAAFG